MSSLPLQVLYLLTAAIYAVRSVGLMFFALPGWLFLHSGSKLARIELASGELRFVLRFGIFFYRRVRFSRRSLARATFAVRLQRLFTMELGQEQPDVLLTVKRFLRSDHRLLLNCSIEAATWIAGGLRAWQAGSGAGRLPAPS